MTPTVPDTDDATETSTLNAAVRSRRFQTTFPVRGRLPSIDKVRSSKNAQRIAIILMVLLAGTVVMMAFSPWLQTVRADGSVMNYDPKVRPQQLQAPIDGRIVRLGEGIREMALVKQGQLIAEMADLDPERLTRMRTQLDNLRRAAEQAEQGVRAAERERDQTLQSVAFFRSNVETLRSLKREAVAAAEALVEVARQKLVSAEQTLEEKKATQTQTEADYRRQKQLFVEEIASEAKFQEAERKYNAAVANVAKANADILAAKEEIAAKIKERDTKGEAAESSIQSALATLQTTEAKVEGVETKVAKAKQDFQKATNAVTEAESSVRRQENQRVLAPIDGYLVELSTDAGSRIINRGDPIAKIAPESEDRIVQVWLDGNDAPLVEPGRHVRLQFEGWPAIQFSGWPSVAVGTFGGEVLSVDAFGDGSGRFRALIGETSGMDEETGLEDEPWPHGRFLRPGVRANSWVMLETVPLWWEVWRNLNGFPPVVDTEHEDKPSKVPKLPK